MAVSMGCTGPKHVLSPSHTVFTLVNKDYLLRFDVFTIIETHLIKKNTKNVNVKHFANVKLHDFFYKSPPALIFRLR